MPPIAPMAQLSGSGFGNVGSYSKIGTWTVCAVTHTTAATAQVAKPIAIFVMAAHYTTEVQTRYSSPRKGVGFDESSHRWPRKDRPTNRCGGHRGGDDGRVCARPSFVRDVRPHADGDAQGRGHEVSVDQS